MTVSNYRPISLLSVFSKISEKLVYKRLYYFLELHEIMYNLQFGFRASHSVIHALISLTESIKNTLGKSLDVPSFLIFKRRFIQSITGFSYQTLALWHWRYCSSMV